METIANWSLKYVMAQLSGYSFVCSSTQYSASLGLGDLLTRSPDHVIPTITGAGNGRVSRGGSTVSAANESSHKINSILTAQLLDCYMRSFDDPINNQNPIDIKILKSN